VALLVARGWYFVLPALYLAFLLGAKLLPLLPGALSRDARRRARAGYSYCLVRCAGVGRGRQRSESALEHAARLSRDARISLTPVADVYLKASFGEHFDPADLVAFGPALRGFSRTFRMSVALPWRILGALSPLGAGRHP